MALILAKTLDSGVQAEYWRIVCLTRNQQHNLTFIDLYGYYNKTMRVAGKDQLVEKQIRVTGVLDIEQPLVVEAYAYLKTLPEWDGAQDDL